jgi:DNA topoisomerase IB
LDNRNQYKQEFHFIYESLQEGIIQFINDKVTYTNSIFKKLYPEADQDDFIHRQIFKVYDNKSEHSKLEQAQESLSLVEILKRGQDFLKDKVFLLISNKILDE